MTKHLILRGTAATVLITLSSLALAQSAGGIRFDGIDVRGNTRLSDAEAQAMCGLDASRTYSEADLAGAVQCLGQSEEYKTVSLGTEGRTLIVNVEEAPIYTGLLDVSVSADTDRGISGRIYIEDRDFLDRGMTASGELELSREEKTLGLALVDPDLFDSGHHGGVALSYGQFEYDGAAYSFERLTVAPFVTVPLSDTQSVTFRGGVQVDEVDDIDPGTSPILLREGGQRTSPFVSLQYAGLFDLNTQRSTQVKLDFSQSFVGLGQDDVSSITRAGVALVSEVVPDSLAFALEIEGGHVETLSGGPTRVVDRFFLGGNDLRGFAPRGIGPLDGGQFLGGNSYAVVRAETNSPITTIAGAQVSGGLFADMGAVWGLDNTNGFSAVDDDAQLRASVGVSMTVQIGDVPLNLYYAHPVESEAQDNTQTFGLAVSTRF